MLLWHWACLPVSSVTRRWGYFSAPAPDATCVRSARAAECVPHRSLRKRLITPGIFHMPLWAIFAPHTVPSWRGSAFSWWNDPEWSTSLVKPYQVIQCEHKEMLMVVADLFVGWLSFQDAFSPAHVFLKSPKVKRAQLASKQLKEKCRFYQLKKQRVLKSPPQIFSLGTNIDHMISSGDVCLSLRPHREMCLWPLYGSVEGPQQL